MINEPRGEPDDSAAIPSSPSRRRTWLAVAGATTVLALAVTAALASVHRLAAVDRQAAASAPAAAPAVAASVPAAGPDLSQWCTRLSAEIPGIASPACRASGLVAGAGRSVRGVPLWSHDVLPAAGATRFKVLVLGGIH